MKKILLIVIPLLVIVTTVLGLGFMGIIKLPFLPAKKVAKKPGKAAAPVKAVVEKKPAPPPIVETPKPKPKVVPLKPDIEAGQKKLAALWNEMEPPTLVPIIKDWKDQDLAPVLMRMDADKVTELMGALDPDRASRLSRAIEAIASKPKPAPSAS